MEIKDKKQIVDKAIKKADLLSQRGILRESVEILLAVISNLPEFKESFYACAKILMEFNEYEHSFDLLKKIPDQKNDSIVLELSGYCLAGMGKDNEAAEYAEKALLINPLSASALNLKGELAFKRGELKEAEYLFKKGIQADSANACSYTNLGLIRLEDGRGEGTLDLVEKGFDLLPADKNTAVIYHEIISELNEFKRGERHFIKAHQAYPDNKRLLYLLIDIFMQQNNFKKAMCYIETALIKFGVDDNLIIAAQKVRDELGPVEINSNKKGKTLSLCMIVRDEENDLAKCLKSVKGLVDEVIITDTGSVDKTVEVAKIFGAKIYKYKWNDSFSDARNYSINMAEGDWIFILDADEVVSSVDCGVLGNLINMSMNNVAYRLMTRNYVNDWGTEGLQSDNEKYQAESDGIGWVGSEKVRLFPNDKRARFENRVHEFVEPSLKRAGMIIKECTVPIHHYGKLNAAKMLHKKEKYYQLGKMKLHENKENPKAIFELGVQAIEVEKYDDAIELLSNVIMLRPDYAKAFFNMGYAYIKLRKYQEGLNSSQKALELDPDINEALTNCAVCEIRGGSVKNAIINLENLLKKNPAHILGYGLLAVASFIEKNIKRGIESVNILKKNKIDFCEYFYTHAERLVSAGRTDYAVLLLKSIVEAEIADSKLYFFLEKISK